MAFESIQNHYERLVFDEINRQLPGKTVTDRDYLDDVACIALNNLPPRYIRHNVDLLSYLSDKEHEKMVDDVRKAVAEAFKLINRRQRT